MQGNLIGSQPHQLIYDHRVQFEIKTDRFFRWEENRRARRKTLVAQERTNAHLYSRMVRASNQTGDTVVRGEYFTHATPMHPCSEVLGEGVLAHRCCMLFRQGFCLFTEDLFLGWWQELLWKYHSLCAWVFGTPCGRIYHLAAWKHPGKRYGQLVPAPW